MLEMHRGPIIQTGAFLLSGLLAVAMTEINQTKAGFALSWAKSTGWVSTRRWPNIVARETTRAGDIRPSLVRGGGAGGVGRPSGSPSIAGMVLHCRELVPRVIETEGITF